MARTLGPFVGYLFLGLPSVRVLVLTAAAAAAAASVGSLLHPWCLIAMLFACELTLRAPVFSSQVNKGSSDALKIFNW